jgi:8-oxo-dGTP pyrophosphatase MutT (NUDIX family)
MYGDLPTAASFSNHELVATSSKVVYRNRWMTVREDETLRFDGHRGIFGVVTKPDFALIVPYSDGGFHLVEQYRYPVRGRYWEFPQGSWDGQPDADPVALAAGELQEETGLQAGSLVWLGHLFAAFGYCDQGFNILLATHLVRGETKLDDEERGLVSRWFSEEEVWLLIAEGRFKDAPSIAALALFERHRCREGLLA